MSINSIGGNPTPTDPRNNSAQGPGGQNGTAAGDRRSGANSTDTVKISTGAADLQAMEARLAELPDVDSGRVEAIRSQIANGEYQIDSQKLADRILAFESDL